MSADDEPDSLLRAVAASPPIAPPPVTRPEPPAPAPRRSRRRIVLALALPVVAPFIIVASLLLWGRARPPVHAVGPAVVDASTRHLSLAPYLDVLDDPSRALTIDDVKHPEHARRFTPSTHRFGLNQGFTASAVWARFSVENAGDAPLEQWLVMDTVTIETLEVFRDDEPRAVQGVLHPRSERELPRRAYSFRVTLAPHQTRTIFVRASGDSEIQAPMELWELGALLASDRAYTSWDALLYGVMLAMALYNALLFLFVRDRTHLYYAAYIVCGIVWIGCLDGTLLDVLPARVETIPRGLNAISAITAWWFVTFVLRRMLDLRATHPLIGRACLVWMFILSVVAASYLVGALDYRRMNLLLVPLATPLCFVWIGVSALRWREGVHTARWLVLAWSAYLVFAGVAILSIRGALLFRIGLAPHLGETAEAILFSVALADAARRRNDDLARAHRASEVLNEELRRQIADRAGQLAAAIARLSLVAPRTLAPGALVEERYRVIERLGAGGMGAVYRVERVADGRPLALKIMTGVADREALARFAREAQVAAQLDHPNVVSVLDVDVSRSGMLFLVMELVPGTSLAAERTRYGDARWALPILRQIAAALAAMHARSIVHRDLKPSNILLDGDQIKVADFGLAGLIDQAPFAETREVGRPGAPPDSPALTRTGAIMGTPLYMAPELVSGARHAGPSADLFSFGIVAYELLSKELPFPTPPVVERLNGRATPAPTPLAQARPDLPSVLAALVDRCLADEPGARPGAEQVVVTLDSVEI